MAINYDYGGRGEYEDTDTLEVDGGIASLPITTAPPVVTSAPTYTQTDEQGNPIYDYVAPVVTSAFTYTQTDEQGNPIYDYVAPVVTSAPVTTIDYFEQQFGPDVYTPVVTSAPVVTEAPVVTSAPVVTEAPVVTFAPATTSAPVVTDAPTTTSVGIATLTTTPAPTTLAPVVTDAPTTTPVGIATLTTTPTPTPTPTNTTKWRDFTLDNTVVDNLFNQITAQQKAGTAQYYQGQGLGSIEANTREMANILASVGITDIKQLGKVPTYKPADIGGYVVNGNVATKNRNGDWTYETPTGKTLIDGEGQPYPETRTITVPAKDANPQPIYGEFFTGDDISPSSFTPYTNEQLTFKDGKALIKSGETFGNKETGQAVPNTYSERQTGNAFGGTFAGSGNTGYRVQFAADGTPIFYTTKASSNDLANFLADLGPIGQIGIAIATGGLSIPQQIAAQFAIKMLSGSDLQSAIKSAAASFVGSQIPGLDAMKDATAYLNGIDPTGILAKSFTGAAVGAGTGVITGQDLLSSAAAGAASGGYSGAADAIMGNFDLTGLTASQRSALKNTVTGVISGKPLDQTLMNSITGLVTSEINKAANTPATTPAVTTAATDDTDNPVVGLDADGNEVRLKDINTLFAGNTDYAAQATKLLNSYDTAGLAAVAAPAAGATAATNSPLLRLVQAAANDPNYATKLSALENVLTAAGSSIARVLGTAISLGTYSPGLNADEDATLKRLRDSGLVTIDDLKTSPATTLAPVTTKAPATTLAPVTTKYIVQPGDYTDTGEVPQDWQNFEPPVIDPRITQAPPETTLAPETTAPPATTPAPATTAAPVTTVKPFTIDDPTTWPDPIDVPGFDPLTPSTYPATTPAPATTQAPATTRAPLVTTKPFTIDDPTTWPDPIDVPGFDPLKPSVEPLPISDTIRAGITNSPSAKRAGCLPPIVAGIESETPSPGPRNRRPPSEYLPNVEIPPAAIMPPPAALTSGRN